jgi:regulator of cell morphogenesis and NO signaling
MNNLNEMTIGEIVTENYRTASIFNNYNIDFCCKGNVPFGEVCSNKNIDSEKLLNEVKTILNATSDSSLDYQNWQIDLLANHIEAKHHSYIVNKTPELNNFLNKLCSVHGKNHPELFQVREMFSASAGELAKHMKKEELILFPYVRQMVLSQQKNEKLKTPHFGTVTNPIQMMMTEHSTEGDRFRMMEEITNNYTVPSDGCTTYKVTYSMLKEFQNDLHLHIHLENNILFPKAILMEEEVLSL